MASYFNFYVILFSKVLATLSQRLQEICLVFQGCLIHMDLYVSNFDSLILLNTFLFFSCSTLLLWLATLTFRFPSQLAIHQYQADKADLLYFQIKWSSFLQKFCLLVFVQLILSVTYIYQLITVQFISNPKMFLFFSLINLELSLKPSFWTHISVCFVLLNLASCRI